MATATNPRTGQPQREPCSRHDDDNCMECAFTPTKRARTRQRLPVLPIEVARDAVREGRSAADVAAAVDSAADRLTLGLELLRAAQELLSASGVHYASVYTSGDYRTIDCATNDNGVIDALYLAAIGTGGVSVTSPVVDSTGDQAYRKAAVSIHGASVSFRGPYTTRCARKMNGAQCTGENGHDGEHAFAGGAL